MDEVIATDRPDFTEASSTVKQGVLQIETGYTYFSAGDGDVTTHSTPEALFRYGIFRDWLELRLAQNVASLDDGFTRTNGVEDLYLGVKLMLTLQDGILPEMSLMPQMTVPTGASGLTSGETLPGLNWLYGWDVTEFISTAGSSQFNKSIDPTTGKTYTEWAQSWTIGYNLAENLGAYTEAFALFPSGADTVKPEYYLDGGFTYRFTHDIQWDIRGGVGLSDASDDYFVGTGLSLRFR
jgi:hypothetical protein